MNHQQSKLNNLNNVMNTTVFDPRLPTYVVNVPSDQPPNRNLASTSFASSTSHNSSQIIEVIEPSELYNTLLEINSVNAKIYFEKCNRFNVTLTQLEKMTDQHMSRMFPEDSELGLLIDFSDDIKKWKMLKKIESKTVDKNFDENIDSQEYSFMNIISLNNKLKEKAVSREKNGVKKTLTQKDRSIMLTLIVEYFRNFRRDKMAYETMEMLANDIQYYFSGELAMTYFYFNNDANSKKRARGKLYNKWNNRNDREEPKKKYKRKKETDLEDIYNTTRLSVTNINNKEDQEKIKLNLAAHQSFPINIILKDWIASYELRFQNIQTNISQPSKIFQEWPFYTQKDGWILVRIYINIAILIS